MSGHRSECPRATSARRGHLCPGVLRVGQDIGDMDHSTLQQGPSSRRAASTLNGHSLDIFDELGRVTVSLREEGHPVLLPSYRGVVGATKAASRFNERLQHRFKIEGRAADNLEHVGGGGLL